MLDMGPGYAPVGTDAWIGGDRGLRVQLMGTGVVDTGYTWRYYGPIFCMQSQSGFGPFTLPLRPQSLRAAPLASWILPSIDSLPYQLITLFHKPHQSTPFLGNIVMILCLLG